MQKRSKRRPSSDSASTKLIPDSGLMAPRRAARGVATGSDGHHDHYGAGRQPARCLRYATLTNGPHRRHGRPRKKKVTSGCQPSGLGAAWHRW
jgi:hypothetical protein